MVTHRGVDQIYLTGVALATGLRDGTVVTWVTWTPVVTAVM